MGMKRNVWGVAQKRMQVAFLGSCAMAALVAGATLAQAEPHMEGEVAVEFAGNHVKQGDAKQNDINPTVELASAWVITKAWSVQGGWTLESVYEGDDDFYFRSLALSTDELYLQYETGMFRLFGGKANPTFGRAWDIAPGVYGTGLAEDYEIGEGYIAVGLAVTLEGAMGKHILTGTAFRLDRSIMSETAFTKGGSNTLADGGLSNTRGFKSFSVTLDSENVFGLDGLNSHLGYQKQAIGDADVGPAADDQTGYVAGLSYGMDLSAAIKMEVMAEYADFSNFEGVRDSEANYITVGAGFAYQGYNLALAYTQKDHDDVDSSLMSVSVGTEIWNEWALDVGYSLGKEDGVEDVHSIGFTLAKAFEFSSAAE